MRILSFVCVLLLGTLMYSQQIIDNPAVPLSIDAGRCVELKEEFRIEDSGSEFFFRFPVMPRIFPDGSILLKDSDQLLHFDKKGRFLRNYFKKGQGPGEVEYIGSYGYYPRGVFVQGINPIKLIWFDETGKYAKEIVFNSMSGLRFIFHTGNKYYFFRSSFPRISGDPGIVDSPEDLVIAVPGNADLVELGSFPTKRYVKRGKSGGAAAIPMNHLHTAAFENKYLFIQNTPEYSIKLYDVELDRVTKVFNKAYKRVQPYVDRNDKPRGPILDGKVVTPPQLRYANDVENLFVNGDKVWVQTSTQDSAKRTLFDIFDLQGKYMDCVYMGLPEKAARLGFLPLSIFIANDSLLAVEKNEDETYSLVKYLILDRARDKN